VSQTRRSFIKCLLATAAGLVVIPDIITGNEVTQTWAKGAIKSGSMLDRVCARRTILTIKKMGEKILLSHLLEPNDKTTWDSVRDCFVGFLNDMERRQAIYKFHVTCNEENNPPEHIDNGQISVDVRIQLNKSLEQVDLQFTLDKKLCLTDKYKGKPEKRYKL